MKKVKSKKSKVKNPEAGELGFRCSGFNFLLFTFYVSFFAFSFCLSVTAQDDQFELAPPPLKIISKDELTRIEAKTDIKDRTKLSLELMNARLLAAEKRSALDDFDGMFRELGVFHGIMDNTVSFLDKRDNGGGKVLDNFKRLEIGLRGFAPRIEVIRRELPLRYDAYVRKLMGYLRAARTKATESLFDDTVVPMQKPGN